MSLINNTIVGEHGRNKFYNSAKRMDRVRDRQWLTRMINRDKICYQAKNGRMYKMGPIIKKRFIEKLFLLIEVFERKFDNNWDIHLEYKQFHKAFEISFIIHYDKLTITNSADDSRELTDLLVILPIAYNGSTKNVYVREIQGTRLSYQEDEWSTGYRHSHLPSISKITNPHNCFPISKFCIGTEDLSELEIELSVDFDIEKFELMLYTIDSLVAWESIEGGPYKNMRDIVVSSNETLIDPSRSTIADLYPRFKTHLLKDNIPFDFVYVNNRYQIKRNGKFNNYIREAFDKDRVLKQYQNQFLCKRGENNNYYSDRRLLDGVQNSTAEGVLQGMKNTMGGELPFVYIQGVKHHFDIKTLETNKLNIDEFGIHPKFLDYVVEQLESEIYKACVRGSSINRLSNSGNHVEVFSGEDQIFV